MRWIYILLLFCGCFKINSSYISSEITPILEICYNGSLKIPKVPYTAQTLVEILRKLEFDKSEITMRVLTNTILHKIKLDGVVRTPATNPIVLPYRALNKHFYKHQFLVDHLTPGEWHQFPREAISNADLCILHLIISNTFSLDVPPNACSEQPEGRIWHDIGCLEEKGVMSSKWGTVSPGHLIAGIASALQRERVQLGPLVEAIDVDGRANYSDRSRSQQIDNVWAATVVGDLAEVLINQGSSHPHLGGEGRWNDTLFPRAHYRELYNWDMTQAEFLGGIDGLLLSINIKDWLDAHPKLRLSQLIDMYYSPRGVSFNTTLSECTRRMHLKTLFDTVDLTDQVSATAKGLQVNGSYYAWMQEVDIDTVAPGVVETYKKYAESLLPDYNACGDNSGGGIGRLEIIAILDETWSRYDAEKFIAVLSEDLDVSYFNSKLGILNARDGKWVTNITHDLVSLYSELNNQTEWPTTMSITTGLHAALDYYRNDNVTCQFKRPYRKIILFLAQSTLPADDDVKTTLDSLTTLSNSYPDAHVVFLISREYEKAYQRFVASAADVSVIMKGDDSRDVGAVSGAIVRLLRLLPSNIINFFCDGKSSHFEDYLTPGLEARYEIHWKYADAANITVKFEGNGYGDASVCAYVAKSMADKTCKGITVNSEVTFNIKEQCPTEVACTVQFVVYTSNSLNKCSEFDCRYPDQVRMDITTKWSNSSRPRVSMLLSAILFLHYIICDYS